VYLHQQKIVHGDIKEVSIWRVYGVDVDERDQVNILLNNACHIQLCDFGLAVIGNVSDNRMVTTEHQRGTCNWMSPERLTRARHRRSTTDDVYAFGCLCYYVRFPCSPSSLKSH
jgi:serine/threonine protein kinase